MEQNGALSPVFVFVNHYGEPYLCTFQDSMIYFKMQDTCERNAFWVA